MTSPLLEIRAEEVSPGVAVITLAGKLMLGREGEQVEALVPQLLARGQRTIIFDLAGLTRVDSTGIGRFISSFNKIGQAGGRMAITAASTHLRDCFHATQLDRVFEFFDNVTAARAALAPAQKSEES